MREPLYSDTAPVEAWLQRLRSMSAGEKIAVVFQLTQFALDMAALGVRSRYPAADDREVFLRVAALHLSREEMIRAYHWDPQEHDYSGRGTSCAGYNLHQIFIKWQHEPSQQSCDKNQTSG